MKYGNVIFFSKRQFLINNIKTIEQYYFQIYYSFFRKFKNKNKFYIKFLHKTCLAKVIFRYPKFLR